MDKINEASVREAHKWIEDNGIKLELGDCLGGAFDKHARVIEDGKGPSPARRR